MLSNDRKVLAGVHDSGRRPSGRKEFAMTDHLIPAGIRDRVREIVSQLTLEEKALLTVGRDFWTTQPVERLGVPSIWLADGPGGVRKAPTPDAAGFGDSIPATCFP